MAFQNLCRIAKIEKEENDPRNNTKAHESCRHNFVLFSVTSWIVLVLSL